MAETGIGQPLLQAPVLGEDQQPFTVGIQPAGCVHTRHVNQVGQAAPAASWLPGELAENPERLVQQQGQE